MLCRFFNIWLLLLYPHLGGGGGGCGGFLFSPLCCSFSLSILHMLCSYVIIFLHHFSQVAISIKISNLIISFFGFDLSCPILKKDNFIENLYIVLSCQ